jgi:hypothetical protein
MANYTERESSDWRDIPFSPSLFTGRGAMSWTVDVSNIVSFMFLRDGPWLAYSFFITGTTLGGIADLEARIAIGAQLEINPRHVIADCYIRNAGVQSKGLCSIEPGASPLIRIILIPQVPFTLGSLDVGAEFFLRTGIQ